MLNKSFKCLIGLTCVFLSACASSRVEGPSTGQVSLRPSSVSGRFVVTAVSGRTVVYRPVHGAVAGNERYVVEYRDGLQVPAVGTSIERTPENGFRLVGIARSVDGARTFNAIDLQAGASTEGPVSSGRTSIQPIPSQRGNAAGLNDF
jgi:hypothetical protein